MNAQPMAPQQGQAQPGGFDPSFIDAIAQQLAADRVEAEKAAVARHRALNNPAGNPQQPTVVQSMQQQALSAARDEVLQKLQALGLAPQVGQTGGAAGGAPGGAQMAQAGPQPGMPQGPGGPPAANPPTPMFQGGITRAKSNLPQQYAGGGIVAFEAGGYSTEKQMRTRASEAMLPDETTIEQQIEEAKQALATAPPHARGAIQQFIIDMGRRIPMSSAQAQERSVTWRTDAENAAKIDSSTRNREKKQNSMAALASRYMPQEGGLPAALDDEGMRQRYTTPRQVEPKHMPEAAPTPPSTAPQDPQAADLRKALQGSLIPAMQRDPEAARRQETERYRTEVGAPRTADMAAQEARIAKMEAMQQAAAANRPGNFMEGLMRMGENQNQRGIGGAFSGVARGITDKQAGYAKEDLANAGAMSGLRAAAADAAHQNRAGQYGVGVGAEEKARKGVQDAMGTAERLSATDEQTAMRREVARINALAAQARSGGSEEKGAARKEIVNFIEKIDAELKAARDDFMNPMPPERRKRLEQQRDAAMQALGAMNDLGTTTAAAPSLVGWGEPKVKSK